LITRWISCIALIVATAAAAAESPAFTAESLLEWQFVGDPRISPDGRRIVFVQARVDREKDRYDRDLWMAGDDGPARQLTAGKDDDDSPRWSPDGRRLAFASDRSGKRQLHLLEFPGGEPWQLTVDDDGVGSFAWSPDGKRIAFTSRTALEGDPGYEPAREDAKDDKDTAAKPPFVTERLIYRNDGAPGYRSSKRNQIWIVATDRGPRQTAQRLTSGDFDAGDPVWSRDGRYIYFSAVRREDADYVPEDSEIYSVAVDGGETITALTQHSGPDDDPLPSPDGKWIAFTGFDEQEPPLSSRVTNLYVMRPDGTGRRQLAVDFDRNVGEIMLTDVAAPRTGGERIAWTADSQRLLYIAADRGQDHLYEVTVASGDYAPLTRFRQGDLREFSLSRTGQVAVTFSSPTRPADIYSFSLQSDAGDKWREVSGVGQRLASAAAFSEYEELWLDSFDGQRIQGWIIKPPGFDPKLRYPAVLYIHGGPHAMYGTGFFHEFQLLAQSGYVVLITNPRGSTGYGGAFANVIQYRYPGDDFRDLMAGVDALVQKGYVDAGRLGVAGGSGGGLLTSWTVGHTDRFKAAVAERAVTNWHSFVGTSDLNYWFVRHWFRDFPWRDSADYLARSPLSYVDRVQTPVLVIHNEQDYRTALDQGLQFYAALRMQKKPARLAVFPDSSHGMSREGRPSQRVARLKLIGEWFGQYLGK
jgi:dipeptidyl aminopeptidase/acylaminoacyl peptidase